MSLARLVAAILQVEDRHHEEEKHTNGRLGRVNLKRVQEERLDDEVQVAHVQMWDPVTPLPHDRRTNAQIALVPIYI